MDCGKSTLAGHLGMELRKVPETQIEENSKIGTLMGKGSFKYAFVTDRLVCERERGISTLHFLVFLFPILFFFFFFLSFPC